MFKLKMSRHISLISILRCAVPLAMLVGTPAWALYKVVGPDGKVTYTDRPPVDQNAVTLKSNGATSGTDNLPYDLKKVVDKYPVTLFTSSNCAPCDAGRRYLQARGVPFTEKTVSTDADIKALSKQESVNETPVLKVGTKQLLGFAQSEWASYLDAAGYPAQSRLPALRGEPASGVAGVGQIQSRRGQDAGRNIDPQSGLDAAVGDDLDKRHH